MPPGQTHGHDAGRKDEATQDETTNVKTTQDETTNVKTTQDETTNAKTTQDETTKDKTTQDEITRIKTTTSAQAMDTSNAGSFGPTTSIVFTIVILHCCIPLPKYIL